MSEEKKRWIRELILGGQDGLVNVLGIVLGVVTATQNIEVVLVSSISALFAESVSMGAVAYTSSKAANDYYESIKKKEEKEIEEVPEEEKNEVREIYRGKGFTGDLLDDIVEEITSDKESWINTMMKEEFNLSVEEVKTPLKSAWIVFIATVLGSLVPIIPFFFMNVFYGTVTSILFSSVVLFSAGVIKSRITIGDWKRSGTELLTIGLIAAVSGFGIGKILELWLL